jgi:hypothetical protein
MSLPIAGKRSNSGVRFTVQSRFNKLKISKDGCLLGCRLQGATTIHDNHLRTHRRKNLKSYLEYQAKGMCVCPSMEATLLIERDMNVM